MVPGLADELLAVFGKCVIGCLRIVRCDPLIAADGRERFEECISGDPVFLEDLSDRAVGIPYERKEQVLNAHVFVAQLLRLIFSSQKHFVKISAHIDSCAGSAHLVEAGESPFRSHLELPGIDTHLLNELQNKAVIYGQNTVKQMLLFDLLISVFIGKLFALIHSFNGLLCKLLNIHCACPPCLICLFYNYYNTRRKIVKLF